MRIRYTKRLKREHNGSLVAETRASHIAVEVDALGHSIYIDVDNIRNRVNSYNIE